MPFYDRLRAIQFRGEFVGLRRGGGGSGLRGACRVLGLLHAFDGLVAHRLHAVDRGLRLRIRIGGRVLGLLHAVFRVLSHLFHAVDGRVGLGYGVVGLLRDFRGVDERHPVAVLVHQHEPLVTGLLAGQYSSAVAHRPVAAASVGGHAHSGEPQRFQSDAERGVPGRHDFGMHCHVRFLI